MLFAASCGMELGPAPKLPVGLGFSFAHALVNGPVNQGHVRHVWVTLSFHETPMPSHASPNPSLSSLFLVRSPGPNRSIPFSTGGSAWVRSQSRFRLKGDGDPPPSFSPLSETGGCVHHTKTSNTTHQTWVHVCGVVT